MALIGQPGTDPVDRQVNGTNTEVNQGWRNFFQAVFNILTALTMSGTTADRPTKFLWVGRPYFDTTLGMAIFLKTVNPIVWDIPPSRGLPAGGIDGQIVRIDATNTPQWSNTFWPDSLDTSGVLHQGIGANNVITRQSLTFDGAKLQVAAGYASNNMEITVLNVDGTSGTSNAVLSAEAAGAGGGDALMKWTLTGLQTWSAGVDISASNAWKLSASGVLGTTDRIAVSATTGAITITVPPAYVAADKYLVIDSSGNIHVSTLGPGA